MNITEELENEIKSNNNVKIEEFNHKKKLRDLIKDSGYSISNISSSMLGRSNYLYEILHEHNNKNFSRDIIIAVLKLIDADIETAHRILQGFGHSKIYIKKPRDRIIYEAFINKTSLDDLNHILLDNGFKTLQEK